MSSPAPDRFDAGDGVSVRCVFSAPVRPRAVLVFGHGAGAGMTHAHMVALADAFSSARAVVMRFNFPFIEAGRRRVDPRSVSTRTIAAATRVARAEYPELPLLLGGHSYGGRMASHAICDESLDAVAALVFCSFPLHPAGRPGTGRAAHLDAIERPMLFLSGTRDALAEPALLTAVVAGLGTRARLHWLDTADHGYKILKRTRTSAVGIYEEAGLEFAGFLDDLGVEASRSGPAAVRTP